MSLPALLDGSPRTLGGRLRQSQLAGSTIARLAVSAARRLKACVPRSASKVLPLCASAPAGERSRVRRSSELGRRNLDGQSFLAAWSIGLGVRHYSFCPEGWGYVVTARRTHSVFASCFLFAIPSFLFVSGLTVRLSRVVVVGWPHSSRSARCCRLFTSVEVLGQPSPRRAPRLPSHRAGGLLLYVEVDDRFCFSFRWFSGAVSSGCFGACGPEVGACIFSHGVSTFFCSPWRPVLVSRSDVLGVFPRVCPATVSPGITNGRRATDSASWMVLVMVSERRLHEFPDDSCEHFSRGESLHCGADRGLHGASKRPWPLGRGGWPCLRAPVAFLAGRVS